MAAQAKEIEDVHRACQQICPIYPDYAASCLEKLSEKSRTRPRRSPVGRQGAAFAPFWPPYTSQIHAWSVASILFGQSQKVNSRKSAWPRSYTVCVPPFKVGRIFLIIPPRWSYLSGVQQTPLDRGRASSA